MLKKENSNQEEQPRKGGKSKFAKVLAWIHLWPSLVSAVIVIFVCLTGTIIVYCDEIIDYANKEVLYVPEVKEHKLPMIEIMAKFKEAFPKRRNPGYMVMYKDPARSIKFNSFDKEKGLRLVYMDPYTGQVLKDDGTIYFFYVTAHLHASLLWRGVGNWIVAIATIIFLIELITGLILWWPVRWTKKTREQSFKVKWKAKFKRVNYDLHNVLGFYAFAICMVLTVTGLIISFKPLSNFTVSSFGGYTSHDWEKKLPAFKADNSPAELNDIVADYFEELPWTQVAQVRTSKMDSSGYYAMSFAKRVGLKSTDGNHPVFFDRYTGQELNVPEGGILHEKIENAYWALHMGTWMGWFGKLMTFLGGLIATSLPITGFYIWWGRRKKKNKLNRKTALN